MILTTEITEGGELYQQKDGVFRKLGITGRQLRDVLVDNEKLESVVKQNQILSIRVRSSEADVERIKGYMKQMKITLEALI